MVSQFGVTVRHVRKLPIPLPKNNVQEGRGRQLACELLPSLEAWPGGRMMSNQVRDKHALVYWALLHRTQTSDARRNVGWREIVALHRTHNRKSILIKPQLIITTNFIYEQKTWDRKVLFLPNTKLGSLGHWFTNRQSQR